MKAMGMSHTRGVAGVEKDQLGLAWRRGECGAGDVGGMVWAG